MATFLKENPYLGREEVSACPLYRVSASQMFHCIHQTPRVIVDHYGLRDCRFILREADTL